MRDNGGVSLYRDEGVVLRTQKLGEADRIISMLTRQHGRVRAVAKGVRRTSSRFGGRLEPFSHVDVQVHVGRSLDIVTQVESLTGYGKLIAPDYARYTAGTAMLETAERFTDAEKEPAVQQYLLLVGGLRTLATGKYAPRLVLDAFVLRSLAVAGYAPSFVDCARCGLSGLGLTSRRFFAIALGGVVCADCRPPGAATPAVETITLLGALLSGDWETVQGSEQHCRREASGLVAAYLQWHLERGLRSLPLVGKV